MSGGGPAAPSVHRIPSSYRFALAILVFSQGKTKAVPADRWGPCRACQSVPGIALFSHTFDVDYPAKEQVVFDAIETALQKPASP